MLSTLLNYKLQINFQRNELWESNIRPFLARAGFMGKIIHHIQIKKPLFF